MKPGKNGSQLGFHHRPDGIWCDNVHLDSLAKKTGTPCYVYSRSIIDRQLMRFASAFKGLDVLPCYAAKANNNPEILRHIAGHTELSWGIDAVSVGELHLGLAAGFRADQMIFSGVGKQHPEIDLAVERGIIINVESLFELDDIIEIARSRGKRAKLGLRVNPNIDAHTHPKISTGLKKNKFGLSREMFDVALRRIAEAPETLQLAGISTHIGSQITDVSPWKAAALQLVQLADSIHAKGGTALEFIDFGGGFPVRYDGDNEPPGVEIFSGIIRDSMAGAARPETKRLRIVVEPGRWLVAESGGLLTRVIGVKERFVVVDASMTELIRPALYGARHEIIFACNPAVPSNGEGEGEGFEIVGPVCESSDVLASNIRIKHVPKKNQLAVLMQAGAYGYSMASNYNQRPLPAEHLIADDKVFTIRKKQLLLAPDPDLFDEPLDLLL